MSSPNYVPGAKVEADREFNKEQAEGAFYGRKFNCVRNFGHYEANDMNYCAKCPDDIKTKCMKISKQHPEFKGDEDKTFPRSMLSSSIGDGIFKGFGQEEC